MPFNAAVARSPDDAPPRGRRRGHTARRAAHRLVRYLRSSDVGPQHESLLARADRALARLPLGAALQRRVVQAGVPAPVAGWLASVSTGVAATGTVATAIAGPWWGLLALAAGAIAASAALVRARAGRLRRIDAQLPAVLDMLVGQLRSHRSIAEAVSDVAAWVPDPLGAECRRVAEELRIGVSLPGALERLRDRVPAPAMPAIVTAIVVADRTGANLAECLSRQAAAARAQVAFRQELSAMTAHARATGMMLALLPLGIAAAMLALDPAVFEPMLTTGPGRMLLGLAAAMELAGWQAVRWMIRRAEA